VATSETARLLASLELKDKFSPTIKNANRALGQFDAKLSGTETRSYRAGQQIGTGMRNIGKLAVAGFGIVAANVALGLDSLIKLEQQTAQTEAVIKSTGGVAGLTAKDINRLAEEYEGLNATMGDEVIQSGANLLLTFTNIRKEAFEPTLEAALNMNTALGKGPDGLASTVRTLGKALNDPAKGLGALSRVGITFDKTQTERIKKLQQEGRLYEAQSIIIAELDKRFGGSFLAQGDTTAGKVAKFADAIEDIQRSLATAALPAVGNIADALTELLADPQIQKGAEDLGREIGNLFSADNVKAGARALGDVFAFMKSAAPAVKSALETVGTVLKTAVDAFMALPPEIRAILVGGVAVNKLTGGLVSNIAGGVFGALKGMTVQAGVVNVTGGVVNGGAGAAGAAGGVGGAAGFLMKAIPIASIVASVASVIAVQQQQSSNSTAQAAEIKAGLDASIAGKTLPELKSALAAVDSGISRLESNPLHALVQGEALTSLQSMRSDLTAQIGKLDRLRDQADRTKDDTVAAQNRVRDRVQETTREAARGLQQTKAQTAASGTAIQATTRSAGAGIEAAVRSSRDVWSIHVTNNVSATGVTATSVKAEKHGPTAGNDARAGTGMLGGGGW
jgi:hypothetical protein